MPPSYPNGWFKICESTELKKGDIRNVQAFGQNLVLFRGKDGKCSVLDAYCPHLGANLSGGTVVGTLLDPVSYAPHHTTPHHTTPHHTSLHRSQPTPR